MTPRQQTIRDIVTPIAELHRITVAELLEPRGRNARRARQCAMHFLWNDRDWSYEQVALFFGVSRDGARYAVGSYERRLGLDTCRAKWIGRKNAA